MPHLSGPGSVTPEILFNGGASNLCLNPSFENVLVGSHTVAITRNDGNETKNTQLPGWQTYSTDAAAEITVAQTTTGISSAHSKQAMSISAANITASPKVRQLWSSAQNLTEFVALVQGAYFTFSMDVTQSVGTASACRLYVTYDGTGGTTVYSGYHGANTSLERLFVQTASAIPSNCTTISFGIEFASTTPTYYLDNAMAIGSTTKLISLAYAPRLPFSFQADRISEALVVRCAQNGTASAWVACNATSISWNPNTIRPAWATHVVINFYARAVSAGVGLALYARPKNTASPFPEYLHWIGSGYAVNAESIASTYAVPLGEDSLYEVLASPSHYFEHIDKGWVGVRL